MGKSTVLQALLLLKQSRDQFFLPVAGIALNGEYTHVGTAKDALFEGASDENISFEIEFSSGLKALWQFAYEAGDSESNLMSLNTEPESEKTYTENLFARSFRYLPAERIGPRPVFPISEHEVYWDLSIGKNGEFATQFLALHGSKDLQTNTLLHPKADSHKLRDQVEAWLGEISPGARLHATSYSELEAARLEFSFLIGDQLTKKYRSTNVGFGLTYVLPIIVAVLSAEQGSLFLVENPEAHLHPKGQVQIGRLLALAAMSGIQVIVETHSDHVLNGIRLAVCRKEVKPTDIQLHFFERSPKNKLDTHVISPEILETGRLNFWPEGFFDEFDKTLAELVSK
jgi:predicted ATPase